MEAPSSLVTSSLSDAQQVVLSTLMMGSATLSIIGSSTIVYRVVMNRHMTRPYDRIMLGLSCTDIVASIGFLISPIVLPAETSSRVWAIGNDVSCSVLGFLTQLGFSAVWYNNCLSWYFVMTLKYNISAEDFALSYEPYIHAFTIFFFLFTATFGYLFQVYSELPVGMGCWIVEYCTTEENCIWTTLFWLTAAIAISITSISLPICHIMIYMHVRRLFKTQNSNARLKKNKKIQRVAIQGFLYVASFFIAFTPASILRWFELFLGYDSSREAEIFWLLLLHAMFIPSQGFMNMFIYSRPKYLRLKESGVNTWRALWVASFDPDIPRAIERSTQYASDRYYASLKSAVSNMPPSQQSHIIVSLQSIQKSENEKEEDNYKKEKESTNQPSSVTQESVEDDKLQDTTSTVSC